MKVILRIFIPLCAVSFILFGISVAILGTQSSRRSEKIDASELMKSSVYYENYVTSIHYASFSGDCRKVADIDAELYDVAIVPTDSAEVTVTVYNGEDTKVNVEVVDSTTEANTQILKIRPETESAFSLFDISTWKWSTQDYASIKVELPQTVYDALYINTEMGDVEAEGIEAKEIRLGTDVGTILYTAPEGTTADFLGVNVDAGTITVKNGAALSYDIDVDAGEAYVEGLTGEGSIDVDAGEAKVGFESVGGECSIDVDLGSAIVVIPEDTSASVRCGSDLGSITLKTPDYNGTAKGEVIKLNGGENIIDADASVGSITISTHSSDLLDITDSSSVTASTADADDSCTEEPTKEYSVEVTVAAA